jgi:hypothetical protein
MQTKFFLVISLLAALGLAACDGGGTPTETGDTGGGDTGADTDTDTGT